MKQLETISSCVFAFVSSQGSTEVPPSQQLHLTPREYFLLMPKAHALPRRAALAVVDVAGIIARAVIPYGMLERAGMCRRVMYSKRTQRSKGS